MNNFVEIDNLSKVYKTEGRDVKAVDGISLNIKKANSISIIGPSGAGKSTLLHLLGLLDKPTSGKILLDGKNVSKLPDGETARIRNERVGFVFQFYNLLPEFTALENVMMPALIKGASQTFQQVRERAIESLKTVGLSNRISHRPSQMSGGESQRVAIARAIINSPELLLCDEPTGNLDSKTSEAIYDLLFGLKENMGVTLVIVTHNDAFAKKTGHIISLKDGRLA